MRADWTQRQVFAFGYVIEGFSHVAMEGLKVGELLALDLLQFLWSPLWLLFLVGKGTQNAGVGGEVTDRRRPLLGHDLAALIPVGGVPAREHRRAGEFGMGHPIVEQCAFAMELVA